MENPLSKWQLFLQTGHRWPARERQFSGIILCRGYIAIYRNAPVVGRSCWWLSTHLQSYQTFLITPASTVLAEASEGWKSLLLWLCQASVACRLFHPPIVNYRLPETAAKSSFTRFIGTECSRAHPVVPKKTWVDYSDD